MGKHWVYVLQNTTTDDFYELYVGETVKLYQRLSQHLNGTGARNTHGFENVVLVGLYNVDQNCCFIGYNESVVLENTYKYNEFKIDDWTFRKWRECIETKGTQDKYQHQHSFSHLDFENFITERCALTKGANGAIVAGGKYTKAAIDCSKIDACVLKQRPDCDCGFPAEVFLSKKNEIWFKCCIANADWVTFDHPNFMVDEPCGFFKKYTDDVELRTVYNNFVLKQSSKFAENVTKLLNRVCYGDGPQEVPCMVCKVAEYNPIFNKGHRALCKTCLVNRYDEVKNIKPGVQTRLAFRDDD